MEEPRKTERGMDQNMTRGEFLAAGATVALGGTIGAVGESQSGSGAPPQQDCLGPCPPTSEVWAIRAGVLNALWNDVLPRVVADAWYWEEDLRAVVEAAPDHETAIRERMHRFRYKEFDNTDHVNYVDKNGTTQPAHPLSPLRQVAFQVVDDYLKNQGNDRIPVNVRGEGGYDFLLSNQGLEIFVPSRPESARDLLRYYTFRGTGRRPIGTPFYLEHAISATSTETATGPSEIVIRPEVFVEIIMEELGDPTRPECQVLIDCLEAKLMFPLREGLSVRPADLRAWGNGIIEQFPHLQPPETHAGRGKPGVRTTMEKYKCAVGGLRCWQMEGASYRGIMTELPRTAAWIWMEELDGIPATGSYRQRIDDPTTAREVLQERLETMIDTRMVFQASRFPTNDTTFPIPNDWHPQRWLSHSAFGHWNILPPPAKATFRPADHDVVITNRGVYFPRVPGWATLSGPLGGDNLPGMLMEIADGHAGNPVFTDSMRTGGDGEGEN